jgi:isopenicillin-N epimerase
MQLPFLKDQFLLREDMTFLNHGSFGACPRPVLETYQRWQRELERQPVEFLGRRLPGLLAEARAALGAALGARPEHLVLVPNATHAVNVVARSLDLGPGDEVLSSDHEYGASDRTWRYICARRGARYINRPLPAPLEDPAEVVERLWAGVGERTRVIFLSHITSPTALIMPVAELCARARAAGILTVIDGAHAPGQIDLALDALGADFYAGNCHKWLCAPKGAGFLYARPERQSLVRPLVVSWGWEPVEPGPSPFLDLFEWTGTADPAAYLSVAAALEFQAAHGWPTVRAACRALLQDASRQIEALTGLAPLSPDSAAWWAQMRALPLPPCDAPALKARLWDAHRIEAHLPVWNGQPLLRVSIQCYNGQEDVELLLRALQSYLR